MKINKIWLLSVLTIISILPAKAYQTINLSTFQKLHQRIESTSQNKFKQLDKNKTKKILNKKRCFYYSEGVNFYISPLCFLKNKLPEIDRKESVDIMMPYIKNFSNKYAKDKTNFTYDGNSIKYHQNIPPVSEIFSESENKTLLLLSLKDYLLRIPKKHFAIEKMDNLSFYVTQKDLYKRGKCSEENYFKSLEAINELELKPGEKFNYNALLAGINNYCRKTNEEYLFYQGVCGATTQFFRTSLINPYIRITKRRPHSQRYVLYYDRYIYGDDASVYERKKQLEIKNILDKPVYFKTANLEGKTNLISVYPQNSKYLTYIEKKQIAPLKASLKRKIIDKNDYSLHYQNTRKSSYFRKNRETN